LPMVSEFLMHVCKSELRPTVVSGEESFLIWVGLREIVAELLDGLCEFLPRDGGTGRVHQIIRFKSIGDATHQRAEEVPVLVGELISFDLC
jgi:hypothetical protein